MSFGRLTREQLFRMPDKARARVYTTRRVNAALVHAKWSAIKYAQQLLSDGVVDGVTYRGRYGWAPKDRLEMAGGASGIHATLGTCYKVHEALREYATRITIALVESGK